MAEGFKALDAGDLSNAQTRFLKAKALRPEAPEVAEALGQTEGRLRTARIEAARQKALAAEQREDWAGALAAYEEALGMVRPAVRAAGEKATHHGAVALERRIAFFVNQPGLARFRRPTGERRAPASGHPGGPAGRFAPPRRGGQIGGPGAGCQNPGPRHDRIRQPDRGVRYRVGRLGRFGARELSLRPGTYTAVGSRDGYRDQRMEFVVGSGPEPIRVTIVCKVKV